MPYVIVMEETLLRVTLSGTVTRQEALASSQESAELEMGHAVARHKLVDLRAVTWLDLDFRGVAELANSRLTMRFPNAHKIAVVAPGIVSYGFARMFQTLHDHPQVTTAIFGDEPEALRWLGEPGQEPPERPWSPAVDAGR